MLLIADSGSTKADWALVKADGSWTLTSTQGLNPYFHGAEKVYSVLTQSSFTQVWPKFLPRPGWKFIMI
jgi:hypothetical protein